MLILSPCIDKLYIKLGINAVSPILKSRLTIQFFPPQNTRNRLRKRRAQTSNLQVLSQSNSNINKSTKIVTKIVSPKNGHSNSPNSRTTQIPEVSTLVTKQEIAQEKSSGLHQEAITPVVNQLTHTA